MKMLLLGGLVGLALGVGLTVFYFALAEFFRAQAKAFEANQKAAEKLAIRSSELEKLVQEDVVANRRTFGAGGEG